MVVGPVHQNLEAGDDLIKDFYFWGWGNQNTLGDE